MDNLSVFNVRLGINGSIQEACYKIVAENMEDAEDAASLAYYEDCILSLLQPEPIQYICTSYL